MFYNTIYFRGEELKNAFRDAKKQEEIILYVFGQNPQREISPSQMLEFLQAQCGVKWPLTSIRRAFSDLTDAGAIQMLNKQRDGIYGKPEHLWKLVPPAPAFKQSVLFE